MESPGLTEYCGLAGKPGGERGDDPGDWREERGGGVRRDSAAGTDGAGLGAALAGAEGEGAVTQLGRHLHTRNTFGVEVLYVKRTRRDSIALWTHCTVTDTFPNIRILKPANENF